MKISNNFGSPRRNPPQAAWIDGGSEPEIAGSTPREDPTDRTPRKKARSGEAAVDRTKAVAAIKGGHCQDELNFFITNISHPLTYVTHKRFHSVSQLPQKVKQKTLLMSSQITVSLRIYPN